MPKAADRDPIYYRRHYTPEIIELCMRLVSPQSQPKSDPQIGYER
jgi:hypothetical protein